MQQWIHWIARLLLTFMATGIWPVQAQNAAQRPSGVDAAQDMRAIRTCSGTEPFWDLTIENDELKFQHEGLVMELKGVKAGKAIGASDSLIALYQGKVVGKDRFLNVIIMRDNQCSDGMSDHSYAARVHILSGKDLYTGCCKVIGKSQMPSSGASTAASSPPLANTRKATAQGVLRDFKENALRAESRYSQGVEIVAWFVNAKKASFQQNKLLIELEDISLGSFTAVIDSSEAEAVMEIKANRLVSIFCKEPVSKTALEFKRCTNLKYYPLGGTRAVIVYDQLMAAEAKSR